MYKQFFQLRHAPFSIAPDPHYLFMSERHREALAHLLFGVDAGGGFVLLTGEIGAGKTTVCRCFLEQVPPNCNVAYIFNPRLTAVELLRTICEEFRLPAPAPDSSVKDLVDMLNAHLLAAHAAGRNNVLIIDEAQNLSLSVLEQLRLLTNLETSERKLLQIILIGQPELRDMLARPELEQLAQRVIARYHLDALSARETGAYVSHRLAVAGLLGTTPFPPRLTRLIHQITRGVPRRINLLCDRALLGAYALGVRQVDRKILRAAAAEVFGAEAGARPYRPYAIAGVLALLAGGALLASGWNWRDAAGLAQAPVAVTAPAAPPRRCPPGPSRRPPRRRLPNLPPQCRQPRRRRLPVMRASLPRWGWSRSCGRPRCRIPPAWSIARPPRNARSSAGWPGSGSLRWERANPARRRWPPGCIASSPPADWPSCGNWDALRLLR